MIHSDLTGCIHMFFKTCGQFETAYLVTWTLVVRPRGLGDLGLIYLVLLFTYSAVARGL
jgi:hypothetical protein